MATNPRILVLGAGAWGTALALALSRNGNNDVFLWGRDNHAMTVMRDTRLNRQYLPGIRLPPQLNLITADDYPAETTAVVAAVPFQMLRGVIERFVAKMGAPDCIACACKGMEKGTFLLADQVIATVSPGTVFAMLSGPNFALEVAAGRPAAITIGTHDELWGSELVRRFHAQNFRPYLTTDVIGVEIGGAIKNVMAIAAGISDGLNLGANSRAALITRGLAEITRFGIAQGGQLETFMGLSGLGDLVLTCTDDQSRNRRFGLHLAAGMKVEQAVKEIGLVEGATTATALVELAAQLQIELPISEEVAATIAGKTTPEQAVRNLLAREPVAESVGLTSSDQ